jgi:hypothetical protein
LASTSPARSAEVVFVTEFESAHRFGVPPGPIGFPRAGPLFRPLNAV